MIIEGYFVNSKNVKRQKISLAYDAISERWVIKEVASPNTLGQSDWCFTDQQLIFPSFIDIHVHARENSLGLENYKEDFLSATSAALNGGIAAFMEMPNNSVDPPLDEQSYLRKLEAALPAMRTNKVVILPYAVITAGSVPFSFNVPYKIYYSSSISSDHLAFASKNVLEKTLKYYSGKSICFHCERAEYFNSASSSFSLAAHNLARPPLAEIVAVKDILELSEKYSINAIIAHISTKEALQAVLMAKKRGKGRKSPSKYKSTVKVEVTPHHLFYNLQMFEGKAASEQIYYKVNPPIRDRYHQQALLQAFAKGEIDFLASDHAPHAPEEKLSLSTAGISGITHLDTYGHFIGLAHKRYHIHPSILAKSSFYRPLEYWNSFFKDEKLDSLFQSLPWRHFKAGPHQQASFTILDFSKSTKISKEFLKTKSKLSPFLDFTFPCEVINLQSKLKQIIINQNQEKI